ncbi:RNA-protein complex protein Nop10 [Candidatus Woesearchaeota archaeon]|nr:RNA-protein complex protein Nop10 [Candidatus Woesearchaeota archaeon]
MKHIYKCEKCSNYTLKEECCREKTKEIKPAKYSVEDKYAKYRRKYKELQENDSKEN